MEELYLKKKFDMWEMQAYPVIQIIQKQGKGLTVWKFGNLVAEDTDLHGI